MKARHLSSVENYKELKMITEFDKYVVPNEGIHTIRFKTYNQIDDIFNRVVFDDDDRSLHFKMYAQIKDFCKSFDNEIPDCAEKTLAFRRLQEALMYFGAALAKNEKYK